MEFGFNNVVVKNNIGYLSFAKYVMRLIDAHGKEWKEQIVTTEQIISP